VTAFVVALCGFVILGIITVAVYLMAGAYYFRGRADEVEAIAAACAPNLLPIDPGIYRAHVLHQSKDVVGLVAARRYLAS
jgi:hypothetical protein